MEENECRICMSTSDDIVTLFDKDYNCTEVGKMYHECLQLEVRIVFF